MSDARDRGSVCLLESLIHFSLCCLGLGVFVPAHFQDPPLTRPLSKEQSFLEAGLGTGRHQHSVQQPSNIHLLRVSPGSEGPKQTCPTLEFDECRAVTRETSADTQAVRRLSPVLLVQGTVRLEPELRDGTP
ncbi:hypothetical protein NDU88_002234 [Pleurodeles waltl]|uniref:Uncharacterized protein n=1 Tax=Pleurodeles waltl TaxID=8319 RepID=A0AAV7TK67_PLEWA|nr:hypothetical protein NDU88_002234 [Pleurodeles waltl]